MKIIVLGSGMIGTTAARHLARSGAAVRDQRLAELRNGGTHAERWHGGLVELFRPPGNAAVELGTHVAVRAPAGTSRVPS